nr:GNAT family N-acetyltransferase [Nocardioides perillae]
MSDELDAHNAAAPAGTAPAAELSVRVEHDGELVAGISGWTWGQAAGIAMLWVHHQHRARGLGATMLEAFESEAARRGCDHVFTTSFTFQAPGFYEKAGYVEFARWEGVPTDGRDDVHLRKELPPT